MGVLQEERAGLLASLIQRWPLPSSFRRDRLIQFRARYDERLMARAEEVVLALADAEMEVRDKATATRELDTQRAGREIPPLALPEGVEWELLESRHTQTNAPLFVVRRLDRVRLPQQTFKQIVELSKELGGPYSDYNKAAAGYTFYDPEAAAGFLRVVSGQGSFDSAGVVARREPHVQQWRAGRLSKAAANLAQRAETSLSDERPIRGQPGVLRTRRLEDAARTKLQVARSAERIAAGMLDGSVRFLRNIKQPAQIEILEELLAAAQKRTGSSAPQVSDVQKVDYPWPSMLDELAREVLQRAEETAGAKQAARRLRVMLARAHVGSSHEFRSDAELALYELLAEKIVGAAGDELRRQWRRHQLLQRAKITTPEILRETLREYLVCCREEKKSPDAIREAERDVIAQGVKDFTSVTSELADIMVERAQLAPGMNVLVASAGLGTLADAVRRADPDVHLELTESDPRLIDLLRAKGFAVVGDELLDFDEGPYDRILLTLPTKNDTDLAHVWHGFELLKPGGILVAAVSGATPSEEPSQSATIHEWPIASRRRFQDWLLKEGGTWERRSAGKRSTVIVVIRKATAKSEGMPARWRR